MTDEQFERWEDFSIRMAEHCYPNATETRRNKIVEQVKDYFHWRHFQKDWSQIQDWDGNGDNYCLGDCVREFFEEYLHYSRKEDYYTGKFHNQITCCIRAGFDIAVAPSAGVIGFTAGDIRRMWDGNVPDWVKAEWRDADENIIDFDSIPDKEGLWL